MVQAADSRESLRQMAQHSLGAAWIGNDALQWKRRSGMLSIFGITVVGISLCHCRRAERDPGLHPGERDNGQLRSLYAVFFLAYGAAVFGA